MVPVRPASKILCRRGVGGRPVGLWLSERLAFAWQWSYVRQLTRTGRILAPISHGNFRTVFVYGVTCHMSADSEAREYLGVSAVARLLGVDRKTVNRWDRDGTFRATLRLPGGHGRWARADVEAFLIKLMTETR